MFRFISKKVVCFTVISRVPEFLVALIQHNVTCKKDSFDDAGMISALGSICLSMGEVRRNGIIGIVLIPVALYEILQEGVIKYTSNKGRC